VVLHAKREKKNEIQRGLSEAYCPKSLLEITAQNELFDPHSQNGPGKSNRSKQPAQNEL